MSATKINRGKHANFYHRAGLFSLMIPKGKAKGDNNILTFFVDEYEASSVIVDRKEILHVLKRVKKQIDKTPA